MDFFFQPLQKHLRSWWRYIPGLFSTTHQLTYYAWNQSNCFKRLTICEGQHTNSFTSAAASCWHSWAFCGTQPASGYSSDFWPRHPEPCNIGHWSQSHLCALKSPEILPRAEVAQRWKGVQARSSLIGVLQLPAVQKFAKILKYLQTNLKKFLLETYTSQATREKISMSLYCKHFSSAERFNLHNNAASRLGVYGERVP